MPPRPLGFQPGQSQKFWTIMRTSVVACLVVLAGCGGRPSSPVEPLSAEEARAQVGPWLQRAMAHANKTPPDSPSAASARSTLNIEVYGGWIAFLFKAIDYGDAPRAIAAVAQVKDSDNRQALLLVMIQHLAYAGDAAQALTVVNSLPDGAMRQQGLFAMLRGQTLASRCQDAERTVAMMTDAEAVSAARWHIAHCQIHAGQLDAAEANIAKFTGKVRADKWASQDLLEDLAKARRGELRKRPTGTEASMADGSRSSAESKPKADAIPADPKRAEQKAAGVADPSDAAALWHTIAWAYLLRGDKNDARRAVDKLVALAAAVDDLPWRRAHRINAVDLLLELGETDRARELLRAAVQRAPGEPPNDSLAVGLSDEYVNALVAPFYVGLLVRAGEIDEAFRYMQLPLDSQIQREGRMAGVAVGYYCTREHRLDEVEKRLESIPSESAKAAICFGVVTAMMERYGTLRTTDAVEK